MSHLIGEIGDAIRANDLQELLRVLKKYETRVSYAHVERWKDDRLKGAVSYSKNKLGDQSPQFVEAIKATLAIRGKPPQKVKKKTQKPANGK